MAATATVFDGLMEGIYQARLAAMPGQVDAGVAPNMGGFLSVDALGPIGRDRRILRGLTERPEAYALRLRQWLQSWALAATPFQILMQLQSVLGPDAGILRIVTAHGDWWTLDPRAGTIALQRSGGIGFFYSLVAGTAGPNLGVFVHGWDWDSKTSPAVFDQNDMGRFWLICYAPLNEPFEETDDATFNDPGVAGDTWTNLNAAGDPASPDAGVVGLSCPVKWVDLVRQVVNEWRAAGLPCAYAIVSFDADAFDPTGDSTPTSIPDGTWGWHARFNPTSHVREIARFVHADYIAAAPGGVRP
jgi:hypothetical protein